MISITYIPVLQQTKIFRKNSKYIFFRKFLVCFVFYLCSLAIEKLKAGTCTAWRRYSFCSLCLDKVHCHSAIGMRIAGAAFWLISPSAGLCAGYGNIAPRTSMGKIVTIFYTCIGFPLFLLYLSNIGSVLAQSFKWLYAKLCKCRPARIEVVGPAAPDPEPRDEEEEAPRWPDELGSYRSQPDAASSEEHSSSGSSSSSELDLSTVTVPISMCLIIMAVYICGGAMFFARLEENWDFLTSCYFCFISLSTIGFGDYVPGDSIRSETGSVETGFVLTSMYLMLGMAIIAMCFNLMQEDVIQKVRSCARCLGCLRGQS